MAYGLCVLVHHKGGTYKSEFCVPLVIQRSLD